MALQKRSITVRLSGGIETKQDDKSVASTKLLALENAVFSKAVSLVKRKGYSSLPTAILGSAAPISGGIALAVRGDELLQFTADRCYSYVESALAWSDVGAVQSVLQSDRAIAKAPATQTIGDYAASAGIGIAAWEDSRGGVYWCVVEDDGGRIVQPVAQASSTGSRPRCVRVGTKLIVLWAEAALGQIKNYVIDPAEPHTYNKTLFPAVLVNDLVTTAPGYDADTEDGFDIDAAWICWNATAGIRYGILDPSGVIGSPATGWASPVTLAAPATVTVGPTIAARRTSGATKAALAFATASQVYIDSFTYASGVFTTNDSNQSIGYGAGADGLAIGWRGQYLEVSGDSAIDIWVEDRNATVRLSTVTHVSFGYNTGLAIDSSTYYGVVLASKCFSTDEPLAKSYVTLLRPVPLFGVYLTMRNDGIVVARTLPGVAGASPARSHLPSVITGDGGDSWRWIAGAKQQLDGINGDVFTEQGLRLVTLDFADADTHQTAQVGASLYLGGACPQVYDGQGWVEHSFHFGIDWETTETLHVNSTAGVGGMTAGTRAYIFVPEFTLANGEIVLGPPSKPYEVVTAATFDRVTLTVPMINITRMTSLGQLGGQQRAEVRIGVYRSVDGDASAFYRCSSLDPSASGPNGYLVNAPGALSASFIDDFSDDTLETKEPLYTNGGILENDPAPSGGLLAGGKGRLFTNDPSNGNLVRFGHERADGRSMEAPDGLGVKVDDAGGAITALGVLDDALIIFKRSAVYFVAGPGPLANPDAGGFTAPQRIPGDAGCTDPKSIVATPAGLMYKSAKGIWIIDNARQMSYVGAPVESFNSQDITRATLVDNTTQVRFLTSSGSTLLYDYLFGQWSTFTNHAGRDACLLGGVYHYLRTDGTVYAESSGYVDGASSRIPMRIETAWLHFQDALQGLQRIWHMLCLGTRKSQHALKVRYRLDYDTSWSPPVYFNSASPGGTVYGEGNYGDGPYGGSSPTLFQHQVHVGARNQAIQFEFSDVERLDTIRVSGVNTFTVTINEVASTVTVNPGTYTAAAMATLIDGQISALMTFAITAAGVASFAGPTPFSVAWGLATELRDAIGFSADATSVELVTGTAVAAYAPAETPGASFELTELLITGGVKGPAARLPASRSA